MRSFRFFCVALFAIGALRALAFEGAVRQNVPARDAQAIAAAASSEGLVIVAVERLESVGGFIDISFIVAYGPASTSEANFCRGQVYLAEPSAEDSGSAWRFQLLEHTELHLSYAVFGKNCDASLSSRILIDSSLTNEELFGIVKAVRNPKAGIETKVAISSVAIEKDRERATVFLADRAGKEAQMTVLLRKNGKDWVVQDVARGLSWG